MKKFKTTAILNGLGIICVLGATTALILLDIFNVGAIILAIIACYPMAKNVWQYIGWMRRDTIRILGNVLPKIEFSIERTEWNDDHTAIRYFGKFRDDNFMIEASYDSAYIMIYDLPWHSVRCSDPNVPKILEAINEVNSERSNMSVVMCEPNDEGMRYIHTVCQTILPTLKPDNYLGYLMCDMLNRKPKLVEAINKERTYQTQRRGPVGFNIQDTPEKAEEPVSPAANATSETRG